MKNKSLFCLSVIFSAFVFVSLVFGEKMDKIAAIVNGDVITEEEIGAFMKMTDMAEEQGLPKDDPKEMRKQLLERMIEDRLILQEANSMGFKPDERIIDDRIRDIKVRAGSELAFEMALKTQGISLSELRHKLKNQLLIYMAVQREVKSRVQVSPKEVTDYYEAHQDQFVTPESVVVDSVFVSSQEKLSEAQARLSEGKDFKEVAKEYSEKSPLGTVVRGQMKEDLENILFALQPGIVSEPVKVDDGFYIFLLEERMPSSRKSLDQVRDAIASVLEEKKTERRLREWLEALKDKAYISIREE